MPITLSLAPTKLNFSPVPLEPCDKGTTTEARLLVRLHLEQDGLSMRGGDKAASTWPQFELRLISDDNDELSGHLNNRLKEKNSDVA